MTTKKKNPLWAFFASVQLALFLLFVLAGTSILGTVVPQNKSPDEYLHAFGAFKYQLLSVLGIFDMYHSWWFQGFLMLLTVNIVVCSIERLSKTWKIIFPKQVSHYFNRNVQRWSS